MTRTEKDMPYAIDAMKRSLKIIEDELAILKELAAGIPSVEKNIDPIISFLDILKFHINDLTGDDC